LFGRLKSTKISSSESVGPLKNNRASIFQEYDFDSNRGTAIGGCSHSLTRVDSISTIGGHGSIGETSMFDNSNLNTNLGISSESIRGHVRGRSPSIETDYTLNNQFANLGPNLGQNLGKKNK
jgi:hypothetical protein